MSTNTFSPRELKEILHSNPAEFWTRLASLTRNATSFEDLFSLATLRRRAEKSGAPLPEGLKPLRLAILGGYSFYPFSELLQQRLFGLGFRAELFVGDFDNYVAEIQEASSALYAFAPEWIFLWPSHRRCVFQGPLTAGRDEVEAQGLSHVKQLEELCRLAHERSKAEIVLANYLLPAHFDPGPLRARSFGSLWNFLKFVNREIGATFPEYVHGCDLEFLGSRRGNLSAGDARSWFESKQPCSSDFLVEVAGETARTIGGARMATKKVLVLDLDNTLWGGIIGDDGLEKIEVGDTNARGEAFKQFQTYLKSLQERGVLLAVCSKNELSAARSPFEKHPEMVLRMDDFASFKANWNPKSDNLRQIAKDLNLGLDSLAFVDDNPAEIEIVRQFTPEVATLCLGDDPSTFIPKLQDSRWFEPSRLTVEDTQRVQQYQQERERQALEESVTDFPAFLRSLNMVGEIKAFEDLDVPRISQLINKSNQFNLTTVRRTESEVREVMSHPDMAGFTVRLRDRFGDHGLISIVVLKFEGASAKIDTWLMSCRVLKRQVEEEVLNEIVRLASDRGLSKVEGRYIPSPKNAMVKEHYPTLGFEKVEEIEGTTSYFLDPTAYSRRQTHIELRRS